MYPKRDRHLSRHHQSASLYDSKQYLASNPWAWAQSQGRAEFLLFMLILEYICLADRS
jgi:hypothetical protein